MQGVASKRHPVIEEIRQRSASDYSRHTKLGLVIEGGGMRGVYSAGILFNMFKNVSGPDIFDSIYAESAGACNASYFLSGQVNAGIDTYLNDLTSFRFFNPLKYPRILDIDFLIDNIVKREKRLDINTVKDSESDFYVFVTDVEDASSKRIHVNTSELDLFEILRATMSVIPLYNKSVPLDSSEFVDGGISNPVPVSEAILDDCTHILVIYTRPLHYSANPYTGLKKYILNFLLSKWNHELVAAFFHDRWRKYNYSRDISFGRLSDINTMPNIAVICPDEDSTQLTRATIRGQKLRSAMNDAAEKVSHLFDS